MGWWDKQLIDQASDVPCIIVFIISCKIICKIVSKSFECLIYKKSQKKIMIGTSDTLSMGHSSQVPSEPAYHIEVGQIFIVYIFIEWPTRRPHTQQTPLFFWYNCKRGLLFNSMQKGTFASKRAITYNFTAPTTYSIHLIHMTGFTQD